MLVDDIRAHGIPELDNGHVMELLRQEFSSLAAYHAAAHYQHLPADRAFAIQAVGAVNNGRVVDARNGQDQGPGAAGYDDRIRFFGLDQIRGDFRIHMDIYAVSLTPGDIGAHHVGDVAFSRRIGRQPHIAAQHIALLVKADLMPSLGTDEGCAHAAHAAADYQYLFRRPGLL